MLLPAQDVITAKPGLIHYTEGAVKLDGKLIEPKAGEYPEIRKGQQLTTAEGRAEVLLSPGVFLRVAESSGVRMVANSLEDVKFELVSGSALLEVGEFDGKYSSLVVTVGDTFVEVTKRGLFRIDREPPQLKVYEGSATVVVAGQPTVVKAGRQTALNAAVSSERFEKDKGDAFHRWASRRSGYIALANVQAAKRLNDNSVNWRVNDWMYNPYFGTFTYIPATGMYRSPFGYAYYSPIAVERVYYRPPAPSYNPPAMNDGWSPSQRSYSDYSGRGMSSGGGTYAGSASAPPPAAAAPAPSGGARSGDSPSGRGSSGGR